MANLRNRNQFNLSPKNALTHKLTAAGGVLVLCLALLALWQWNRSVGDPSAGEEETFFFSPVADHLFENPANWSPHYPGNVVRKNQQFILEGTAYLTGFDLVVGGTLLIPVGVGLRVMEGNIQIQSTGTLINDGEVLARTIRNEGQIHNNLSAMLDAGQFYAAAGAYTQNARSAQFIIRGSAANYGIFTNYSLCSIGEEWINAATFYQMPKSALIIKGNVVEASR